MNYSEILQRYFEHLKGLLSAGASDEVARAIAAQMAARSISVSNRSTLIAIKNGPDATHYRYRGSLLRVARLDCPKNSAGREQLRLQLELVSSEGNYVIRLKADQAFRSLALLCLKYEDFEKDVESGFSTREIQQYESRLEIALRPFGKEITQPAVGSVELMRTLRRKFEDDFQLDEFLRSVSGQGHYRLDLAPNNIVYSRAAREMIDVLSDGAVTRWHERFPVPEAI